MVEPIRNYCYRCGDKLAEGREQPWKCQSCGLAFFVNSAPSAQACIFNREGKLLIAKRAIMPNKGKYDVVGGFMDFGETIEDCLARELEDELCLKPAQYSKPYYFYSWVAPYFWGD